MNRILHRSPKPTLPDGSPDSVAESFSEFFSEKIQKIRSTFPHNVEHSSTHTSDDVNLSNFSCFRPVTEDEVLKTIKKSPKKSCSLDPLPNFLFMDLIDILIKPITKLINLSLLEGTVPPEFRYAVVTPLLKKPKLPKNELKNYRPVSNLNQISKTLERVVCAQLQEHISANQLHNHSQSAYKAGHSTETALLKIKNDIHLILSQGHAALLVLLDLSAAFDTIDHSVLLNRLNSCFSIHGTPLAWFKSYLTRRSQAVKVGESVSKPKVLEFGVPQGSVLGPILFTMYTSPLSKIISNYTSLNHHFYADDTQIYLSITPNNFSLAVTELQSCLGNIQLWMSTNKLKLNAEKTEVMFVGTKSQQSKFSSKFPIEILGNDMMPQTSFRNLGVTFDNLFTFTKHVSMVCSSGFYHIRDLCRIRRHLTKAATVTLANALVSSRLDYCNSLLYSLTNKNLTRLQRVQNSLCRVVCKLPRRARVSPSLKALHWLPVKFRILFKTCLLTYKALNTGHPAYLKNYLNFYSCAKPTRRSNPELMLLDTPNPLRLRPSSHCQLENSFVHSAPRLWNSLPLHVRTATSLPAFRKSLKTHLFERAFPP